MGTTIERVGVIGLGTMGYGIAQVAATSAQVVALDLDDAAIDRGMGHLRAFLEGGVERGKLTPAARDELLGRVATTTDVAALAGCDLVIESATERRDVKAKVLADVAAVVDDDALITTNTSSLSISELAAHVSEPGRFAGLHFFNPAPVMKLVEVVPGLRTDPLTVERLHAWATDAGKTPVTVKDQPGFLVNTVLMPYLNQAVQELDDGLASAADIDTAVRLGLGYPRGPIELLDIIGLDTHLHATSCAYEDTFDPGFAPPHLLRRLVGAGVLGNKSGSTIRELEGL